MKKVEMLIEQREAIVPPPNNNMRLYAYVKPLPSGEAVIEVWGTQFSRYVRDKGKRVTKRFFRFRTDRDEYTNKDILLYNSWSSLCADHICYSMPESGGRNYHKQAERKGSGKFTEYLGKEFTNYISKTAKGHLPKAIPFLNGFENTKYKYCGFNWQCGWFIMDYLNFWKKHPKAEIISKAQCYQLLTDSFMKRLENDKPFAKYVAKYHNAIQEHSIGKKDIYKFYRENRDLNAYIAYLREQTRLRHEREAEQIKALYAQQYDKRISNLYEKIKDICMTYGAYEVIVPQTSTEMLDEGVAMRNCIGMCYAKQQGDTDICIFLHKGGKPCVDIRISLKTFELKECRAVCNKNAPEDAWEIAHKLAEAVRMKLAA